MVRGCFNRDNFENALDSNWGGHLLSIPPYCRGLLVVLSKVAEADPHIGPSPHIIGLQVKGLLVGVDGLRAGDRARERASSGPWWQALVHLIKIRRDQCDKGI